MPLGSAAGHAADLVGIASAERGLGVVWTQEGSEDLNANLVRFEAEEGVGIHVNDEVDVVVVVNGEKFALGPSSCLKVALGRPGALPASSHTFPFTGGGAGTPCPTWG